LKILGFDWLKISVISALLISSTGLGLLVWYLFQPEQPAQVITIQGKKGDKGNQGEQGESGIGIQGIQGIQGVSGRDGKDCQCYGRDDRPICLPFYIP
jgi:hypothetical protein